MGLVPRFSSAWITYIDSRKRKLVGSLKMNTTLEYSTRVVQEGDRRCKKSTLNDIAYLTPLRIPLMNPVSIVRGADTVSQSKYEYILALDCEKWTTE
jgi:hypothetical protein